MRDICPARLKPCLTALGLAALMMIGTGAATAQTLTPEGFYSTDDLAVPVNRALEAKAAKKRVLVVFDIDDTILTMPQDLGSEAWLSERMAAIKAATPAGQSPNYEPIFFEQSLWHQVTNMQPTQANGPDLIRQVQAAGIPVYALTARDPNIRGRTERALMTAGIDLSSAPECLKPLCERRGRLKDPDIRAAAKKLKVVLPDTPYGNISVSDGVMMVMGQDKGIMLQLLMGSIGGKYDEVIFVDDSRRNIENVVRAAKTMKVPVHVYRYERIWPRNEAVHADPARVRTADAVSDTVRAALCIAVVSDLCAYAYRFPQKAAQ